MQKAHALVDEAGIAYLVPMIDHTGRAAYLAGFHAAQAWLFENLGSIPKTHSGVQGQFAKLVKDIPTFTDENRAFLGRTYNLKAIADYETGPNSHVTPERAAEAIGGRAALHSSRRSASGKPLSAIHPLMRVCRM